MHLIGPRRCRLRDDAGFTLIEMVMSVAILGITSTALFGVVLMYLKTTNDTSSRLTESTDQQFISTYWQNDVSSLGRRTFDSTSTTTPFAVAPSVFVGSAGPGGCGSAAGSVVVAFAWNEFKVTAPTPDKAWDSTPQEVAYVTLPSSSGRVMQRVRCHNGVAEAPQTVAQNLTALPTVSCDDTTCNPSTLPNRVSMTFTVRDADNPKSQGYTTTVSADRRQG